MALMLLASGVFEKKKEENKNKQTTKQEHFRLSTGPKSYFSI